MSFEERFLFLWLCFLCLIIDSIPEDNCTYTKSLNHEYVQALMYIILETVLQILIYDDLYIPHSWITAKLKGHNAWKKHCNIFDKLNATI